MNFVPYDFYESVTLCFFTRSAKACQDLAGTMGKVAATCYEHRSSRHVNINNGELRANFLQSFHRKRYGKSVKVTETHPRFHQGVIIRINGRARVPPTQLEAIRTALTVDSSQDVTLWLSGKDLANELANCIDSVQILVLDNILTQKMEQKFKNLIEKKTLNVVEFSKFQKFTYKTQNLFFELLQQDQFFRAQLPRDCFPLLRELIDEWNKNPLKMTGKSIVCGSTAREFNWINFFRSNRIVECSALQLAALNFYFPLVKGVWGKKPLKALVLEHLEGDAVMYWLCSDLNSPLVLRTTDYE